jgi:hypothetical protein
MKPAGVPARFWRKVEKTETCWLWRGEINNTGYGRVWFNCIHIVAHRIAYQLERGPVPDGLQLDHLCRVRHCVNPDHLEPVTQSVNLRRGTNHSREKTHCPKGHPYDESNTYFEKDGRGRQCKACRSARSANRRVQHKSARFWSPS